MKKIIYCLGTLLVTMLMASCGNHLNKLQSMADDLAENGKDWDADQWESFMRDVTDVQMAFFESEPTQEDIKEYDKIGKSFKKALGKALKGKKAEKAYEKAMKALSKDDEFEKLEKSAKKAEDRARKAAKKKAKKAKDEDEEEDEFNSNAFGRGAYSGNRYQDYHNR